MIEAKKGPAGTQILEELIRRAEISVVDVDAAQAYEAIVAWRRFGKGRHPAALNFGDAFSYALARTRGYPLLYVGADFAKTDISAAR